MKFVLGLILSACLASSAQAQDCIVTYAFGGTTDLTSSGTDPWEITAGSRWDILVSVNKDAVDVNDESIISAQFNDVDFIFVIDGKEATGGNLRLTFADRPAGTGNDTISVHGNLDVNGVNLKANFRFTLGDALDFTNLSEPPPVLQGLTGTVTSLLPIGNFPDHHYVAKSHFGEPLFYSEVCTGLTVTEQLEELIIKTVEINIQRGISNALDKKLDNALAAWLADDLGDIVSLLGAFINHVEAQSGKALSVQDADCLIEAAGEIIASILTG